MEREGLRRVLYFAFILETIAMVMCAAQDAPATAGLLAIAATLALGFLAGTAKG